jgi:hypothetical protein
MEMLDQNPFILYFMEREESPDAAYVAALSTLNELRAGATSLEEFQEILLEDVIFISLNATYYEHLFISLRENREYLIKLIDQFSKDSETRDNEIALQAQDHLNYVLNGGVCTGCKSCDFHHDVEELVNKWKEGDLDFFITLYLGMQTIQFALDQLLYDLLPEEQHLVNKLTVESVLEFRQFVYKYVENKLLD